METGTEAAGLRAPGLPWQESDSTAKRTSRVDVRGCCFEFEVREGLGEPIKSKP